MPRDRLGKALSPAELMIRREEMNIEKNSVPLLLIAMLVVGMLLFPLAFILFASTGWAVPLSLELFLLSSVVLVGGAIIEAYRQRAATIFYGGLIIAFFLMILITQITIIS